MTMRFENGRNFGNQGFLDAVAQRQPYDVSFEIDGNGYIESLENDRDYQVLQSSKFGKWSDWYHSK